MHKEEKDKVFEVETKLAAGWLELSQLISALEKEGVDVEDLKKGKGLIRDGVGIVLASILEEY